MLLLYLIDQEYAMDINNTNINDKLNAYAPPIAYLRIIFK